MLSDGGKACQCTAGMFAGSLERLSAAARRMLESPAPKPWSSKAGAGQSFPQVWKKLWKTEGF